MKLIWWDYRRCPLSRSTEISFPQNVLSNQKHVITLGIANVMNIPSKWIRLMIMLDLRLSPVIHTPVSMWWVMQGHSRKTYWILNGALDSQAISHSKSTREWHDFSTMFYEGASNVWCLIWRTTKSNWIRYHEIDIWWDMVKTYSWLVTTLPCWKVRGMDVSLNHKSPKIGVSTQTH